jgi:hypothetical protein
MTVKDDDCTIIQTDADQKKPQREISKYWLALWISIFGVVGWSACLPDLGDAACIAI